MDSSPPHLNRPSPPLSLSLFAFRCISLTLTLLQCHSKWAYRQLEGSRRWELHIARVFITLALTFTQMDRQTSFVFIFSQLVSLFTPFSLPLSTTLVASEVCHRRRSFKVAEAFYVDGPITITTTTTTTTLEMEDSERWDEQKDVQCCSAFSEMAWE